MKGDFTRDTFRPDRHYSQVLLQQGRVELDADWNEQGAILLHCLRSVVADLIGPHATPSTPDGAAASQGFRITVAATTEAGDFLVGPGHYYVDGILCESPPGTTFLEQPDLHPGKPKAGGFRLVYLDVWERHVTHLQDDRLREVALGGPDTATRAQVVWQVRLEDSLPDGKPLVKEPTPAEVDKNWDAWVQRWQPSRRGLLAARALVTEPDVDPCRTPPGSRYRGAENQLYRVEIHTGGTSDVATFKWSRDNGSVVFPVIAAHDANLELEHLGRDDRSTLRPGDRVELVDDSTELEASRGSVRRVESLDLGERRVALEATTGSTSIDETAHPLLRRWDHGSGGAASRGEPVLSQADGALEVVEGTWLTLEDGVQILFTPDDKSPHRYRAGDYWLIPARTATGDVEWPQRKTAEGTLAPEPLPPDGVTHHFAPLAVVAVGDQGKVKVEADLRRRIIKLWAAV
ncbi:MAG TPA: DUF6519 domain-containing protein [Egibacteraceae bacterium]|jgi:hypothetical protein|nr:DUF6519 domain-containing protein [Egibacteraceae bacterium]